MLWWGRKADNAPQELADIQKSSDLCKDDQFESCRFPSLIQNLTVLLTSSRRCMPRCRRPQCESDHHRPSRYSLRVWVLRGLWRYTAQDRIMLNNISFKLSSEEVRAFRGVRKAITELGLQNTRGKHLQFLQQLRMEVDADSIQTYTLVERCACMFLSNLY